MLTEIRETFRHGSRHGTSWATRDYAVGELSGRPPGRRVWLGRGHEGFLSAFFEAVGEEEVDLDVSRVISAVSAEIANEMGETLPAVQIICLDARLNEVFYTFLAEVVAAIDAGQAVASAVNSTAGEWRSLLAVAKDGIAESKLRGVFGELCVLREAARHDTGRALAAWVGPEGGRHDFLAEGASVEVKTSTLQNRQTVVIHGLRQLDPVEGVPLTLAVVEVEKHPDGITVSDLVEDLWNMGMDAGELRGRLESAGVVLGMPGSDVAFNIVGIKYWAIAGDSPVLRRSALPEPVVNAVSDVRYSLDLGALGDGFTERFDFTKLVAAVRSDGEQ